MMKVKDNWIAEKEKKQKDIPEAERMPVTITDHDLTPLDYFDVVATQLKHKLDDYSDIIAKFITECKDKVAALIDKVKDQYPEKTRKTIEQSYFCDMLN